MDWASLSDAAYLIGVGLVMSFLMMVILVSIFGE